MTLTPFTVSSDKDTGFAATSALAGYSRRHADGIIALGPCMRDRLIARGVPASKIHVADNWADGSQIRPRLPPRPR